MHISRNIQKPLPSHKSIYIIVYSMFILGQIKCKMSQSRIWVWGACTWHPLQKSWPGLMNSAGGWNVCSSVYHSSSTTTRFHLTVADCSTPRRWHCLTSQGELATQVKQNCGVQNDSKNCQGKWEGTKQVQKETSELGNGKPEHLLTKCLLLKERLVWCMPRAAQEI